MAAPLAFPNFNTSGLNVSGVNVDMPDNLGNYASLESYYGGDGSGQRFVPIDWLDFQHSYSGDSYYESYSGVASTVLARLSSIQAPASVWVNGISYVEVRGRRVDYSGLHLRS